MKIGFKLPTLWAPKYTPGIAPDYHVWQKIVDYKVTGSPATSLTFNLLDPEVVLLMHLYDTKDRANHVITNNAVTFDTTPGRPRLGASAVASFNGSSGYLSAPDSADFYFASGDFTIDFWVYFNALSGTTNIIGQNDGTTNNYWYIYINSAGTLAYQAKSGGTIVADGGVSPAVLTTGQWYHIAFVKVSGTIYIYYNGISQVTYVGSAGAFPDISAPLTIGQVNGANYLNGYMQEIRIVKELAKWTASFTPPNAPYYGGGDEDEEYKIVTRFVSAANSNYIVMRPNNDSGANYGEQVLTGNGASISAARDTARTYIGLLTSGAFVIGESGHSELVLYAKSGYVRTSLLSATERISGTTVTYITLAGADWNNTIDNIRSLTVFGASGGLGVGSSIEIYRKKNAVPWWGGVGA